MDGGRHKQGPPRSQEGPTQDKGRVGAVCRRWELSDLLLQAGEGSCEEDGSGRGDRQETSREEVFTWGWGQRRWLQRSLRKASQPAPTIPPGADSGLKPKDGLDG